MSYLRFRLNCHVAKSTNLAVFLPHRSASAKQTAAPHTESTRIGSALGQFRQWGGLRCHVFRIVVERRRRGGRGRFRHAPLLGNGQSVDVQREPVGPGGGRSAIVRRPVRFSGGRRKSAQFEER